MTDATGLSDTTQVGVHIDNVNRPPVLSTSDHQAALGQPLQLLRRRQRPRPEDTLTYAAVGLPEGATLDAADRAESPGLPGPAQAGEYVVTFLVDDGHATSSQAVLIRAAVAPELPRVTIELTPSFPALPGQTVLVHAIADSLADIAGLTLSIDGQPVALDDAGRGTVVAGPPGKMRLEALAGDVDGLIGTTTVILKVRDPTTGPLRKWRWPTRSPVRRSPSATDVIGSVADANLDFWTLELALRGSDRWVEIAGGETPVDAAPWPGSIPARCPTASISCG